MSPLDRLNAAFDVLPRVRFFRDTRPVPAFRALGVFGFYLAVMVTVGVGLAKELSPAVLAAMSVVCGASFYAWALLRRWLTGRENLVLLEHVWIALGASWGLLTVLDVAPWPFLDAAVCGLAFFLAMGRVGCLLVGCCHGLPSSVGVAYPETHVVDGFCAEWVGVRLFPVQLLEALGLVVIGVVCTVLALVGSPGTAFGAWLVLYAVMRFGLEAIRADVRPHLLGISQSRWMALAEVALVIWMMDGAQVNRVALIAAAVPLVAYVGVRAWSSILGARAKALRSPHLEALREATRSHDGDAPKVSATALGYRVGSSSRGRVVSLSSPEPGWDLPHLCALAVRAFPELLPESVTATAEGVIVFELPQGVLPTRPRASADLAYRALGACARRLQLPGPVAVEKPAPVREAYFTSAANNDKTARS